MNWYYVANEALNSLQLFDVQARKRTNNSQDVAYGSGIFAHKHIVRHNLLSFFSR